METFKFSILSRTIAFIFFLSVIVCCNSNSSKKKELSADSSVTLVNSQFKDLVPDSIVHFLIVSACNDFFNHQPPTPINFRNVKVGYTKSLNNEKSFILCGEFLSQEKKEKEEWESFATIKTSGYEQYIGNQSLSFCQKATMVLNSETNLSVELKNKLDELRKQK